MKVKCWRCKRPGVATIHPSVAGCKHCVDCALCNDCYKELETEEQRELKDWAIQQTKLYRKRIQK